MIPRWVSIALCLVVVPAASAASERGNWTLSDGLGFLPGRGAESYAILQTNEGSAGHHRGSSCRGTANRHG